MIEKHSVTPQKSVLYCLLYILYRICLLGDDGVLLYPSNSTPALYHHQALLRYANFQYTGVINMLGLPSTQCPLGLGSWGVPLGIQIVGAKKRDRLCLALALEVEKMAGGWVPPSGVV